MYCVCWECVNKPTFGQYFLFVANYLYLIEDEIYKKCTQKMYLYLNCENTF